MQPGVTISPVCLEKVAFVPEKMDSPRASPRAMTRFWREERLFDGTLSPRRPPSPSPRYAPPRSTSPRPQTMSTVAEQQDPLPDRPGSWPDRPQSMALYAEQLERGI